MQNWLHKQVSYRHFIRFYEGSLYFQSCLFVRKGSLSHDALAQAGTLTSFWREGSGGKADPLVAKFSLGKPPTKVMLNGEEPCNVNWSRWLEIFTQFCHLGSKTTMMMLQILICVFPFQPDKELLRRLILYFKGQELYQGSMYFLRYLATLFSQKFSFWIQTLLSILHI